MAVSRKVVISLPVVIDHAEYAIEYEPLDNGLVKVTNHKQQQLYYVEPKDLIELVIAVCGGTLLKMPDVQRAFATALAHESQ